MPSIKDLQKIFKKFCKEYNYHCLADNEEVMEKRKGEFFYKYETKKGGKFKHLWLHLEARGKRKRWTIRIYGLYNNLSSKILPGLPKDRTLKTAELYWFLQGILKAQNTRKMNLKK